MLFLLQNYYNSSSRNKRVLFCLLPPVFDQMTYYGSDVVADAVLLFDVTVHSTIVVVVVVVVAVSIY